MSSVDRVRVRVTPDGRLTRADAAAFLGLSPKTLAEWHCKGVGPVSRKVGGRCFYTLDSLQHFVATGAREAG